MASTGIERELKGAVTPVFDALILTTSKGDKLDLAPMLVEMAIYEDIFSPVLTGWITIRDSLDLFDTLPLNGSETITSKVYSWNYLPELNDDLNFLHRTFDVLRFTDITQINDYTKEYTIHFASPELKKNESFRLSKGFLNTTISKVVADLFTNDYDAEEPIGFGFPTEGANTRKGLPDTEAHYSKVDESDSVELFVEKTKYAEPVISFPYKKMFDIIDWLAGKALRTTVGGESANFLMFENARGFQFVSVDSLLAAKDVKPTKFQYGQAAQNMANMAGRTFKTERINTLQIQDCYDIISNMRNGVYASKLYSYNLETGNTEEFNYSYQGTFTESESTERDTGETDFSMLSKNNEALSEQFLQKRMFVIQSPSKNVSPITSEATERLNGVKASAGAEEYLQKRISQLGRLSNFRMLLDISANTKHKVGDVIEIDIKNQSWKPGSTATEFVEESNKYYSGNYLITSIKHVINKREYKMNLEVVKDSYKAQIE